MSKQTLAILIGGFLPAVLYGVAGVLQKTASKTGVGPGPYILIIGGTAAESAWVVKVAVPFASVLYPMGFDRS